MAKKLPMSTHTKPELAVKPRTKRLDELTKVTKPPFQTLRELLKLSPEVLRKRKAAVQARAYKAARAAKGFAKIEAVRHLSLLMDSPERAAALVPLIENEPPDIFWPIFLSEWTRCDAAWEWQQKLIPILRRVGPCPREIYLEHAKDNGQFWSSLPDDLTLYRGCSRARVNAISWTTNRSIAEGFAKGHRFIRVPDAVIAIATIRKADIFAATDDRKESEIICLPCVVGIENWTISRAPQRSQLCG